MQSRIRIRRLEIDNVSNKPIWIQQTCRQLRSIRRHRPCSARHQRHQNIYHSISKLHNLHQMQRPAVRAPFDLGVQHRDPLRQRTIRRISIRRHLQHLGILGMRTISFLYHSHPLQDAYSGIYPRWHVGFNITMLRLISFNMDYFWAYKNQRNDVGSSLVTRNQALVTLYPGGTNSAFGEGENSARAPHR